jgi:hypothetical protein
MKQHFPLRQPALRTLLGLLSFFLVLTPAWGQLEAGYVITAAGERQACLIDNKDWQNNPREIRYQLEAGGAIQTASPLEIREFGVEGYPPYRSALIWIDQSSPRPDRLDEQAEPKWRQDTVFLKVLVDAHAALFFYRESDLQRFFFQVAGDTLEPLVFKEYLKYYKDRVGVMHKGITQNVSYRGQLQRLYNQSGCEEEIGLMQTDYKHKDLVDFFVELNACWGKAIVFKDRPRAVTLRAAVGLGVEGNTLSFVGGNFGQTIGGRYAALIELTPRARHQRWAFLLEASLRNHQVSGDFVYNSNAFATVYDAQVDYLALQGALMIRHFVPIKGTRLMIEAGSSLEYDFDSQLIVDEGHAQFAIHTTAPILAGLGLEKGRWLLAARYYGPRNPLVNHEFLQFRMQGVSLMAYFYFVR